MTKMLSDNEICRKIGEGREKPISRSTLWRLRKDDNSFPRPVAITRGVSGTPEKDVDQWLASRPRVNK
jgi:predicted DNA-binding transcriptional regulator AlpA